MAAQAEGVFYDGETARRRIVDIRFTPAGLEIAEGGVILAAWAYDDLRRVDATDYVLRVRSLRAPDLARLELADAGARAELERLASRLQAGLRLGRSGTLRIVAWSLAAAASIVLTAVFLVPLVADRLAPLVPASLERRLGDAVDNQVRAFFGQAECRDPAGTAALATLAGRLLGAAGLDQQPTIIVLKSGIPNAIALPGGRIYVFEGLLRRAESVDEVAGVVAHEIGHVAHRDGLRRLIQAGGTSFLLGLLFGDVTGGGAVVIASRTLVDSAYSRAAETAADTFAADLMLELGRSPAAMGAFLLRLTGSQRGNPVPFLASHPVSEDRLAALAKRDRPPTGPPLLTPEDWQALKGICRIS